MTGDFTVSNFRKIIPTQTTLMLLKSYVFFFNKFLSVRGRQSVPAHGLTRDISPKKRNQAFLNLLKFYVPFLSILIGAGLQNRIPVPLLTRDIFAIANLSPFTGFISNLSVFTWGSSGVICIFSFFILSPINNKDKKLKNFIGLSGLISFWFMLDDFFMLHEMLLPYFLKVPEKFIVGAEFALLSLLLIYYKNIILNSTQFQILGTALLLFGLSVFIDILPISFDYTGSKNNQLFLLEDGSKLMGIVTWFFYFSSISYQQIFKERKLLDSDFNLPS
ncbi:hypothetical protein PCC9214_02380 [Planktothrix tepida]|uniref:Uncharacterized protein n=1 Tax=Planktothrix tepida PCC 9214 TaxID=671072 RepID=A0A1J1LHE2_9CYAN|nr:hypothetical protein PCC9214_02380 [Planktothrix tepida]CUR31899.1 conserved membrane hypothetical protein [Planktothrix tepida PCC 9214]